MAIEISFLFKLVPDDSKGEAVVTLGANGLNQGAAHAPLGGDSLVESQHSGDSWVVAFGGIDHSPSANDVIADDNGPSARMIERLSKVIGVAWLVGVDKDKVKGPRPSAGS